MTLLRRLHARRERGDRGAVLIEFALVAPILLMLVVGIFEYGNAYRQIGGVERSSQQGARTAASMANHRMADYEALRAIDTATRGLQGVSVDRVIIYRSTRADGAVPNATCFTSSVSGVCNTYTGAQVRNTSPSGFSGGNPRATTCAGSVDAAWCPLGRSRQQATIARIGVHITLTYESVTNLLPTTITLESEAVFQIDPCQQGETTC
ncbi:MAG TPA: TadE/TadG family type IV pilus assembly protein [Protaetiibacter sp.]|nr:TadE/TadG family type IV pilus assembly protein [Protaetiibacter sp.]